jgi:ribosomal protein L12E/L44/L45/RPP1/RPP2
LFLNVVRGAIDMAERVSRVFASIAREAANLAATFELGGVNIFAAGAKNLFKGLEERSRNMDKALQGIGLPSAVAVGAIAIPGQAPATGGGGGGAKPKRDTAAEEKQRLDALLKQLQEEIRIRTESIGLEKSLLDARADQNDELEAQIQSSIRLLDIGSKQAVVQKNFEAGKIGRAEYMLRLQLLELDRVEDQIKYEEDLNRIFKERYGITEAIARLAREARSAAFGGTGATGTFRTDLNLLPGLTGGPLGEEYDAVKEELTKLTDPINIITNAAAGIGDAFATSFKGIIDGSMTAREALASFFTNVADMFLDMAAQIIAKMITMAILNQILGVLPGFSGGGGGAAAALGSNPNVAAYSGTGIGNIDFSTFSGARANGGPVSGGRMYMVGERGPELFVPNRSGTIVANDKMGGSTTNVVVNVDAKGSSVEGNEQSANQLGRVISAAVQSELIKQQRPGGILAR